MLSSSATFMDNFFNALDLRKSKVFLSIIQLVLITHLWLFEVSKWKISSILSFPCPPLSIYTAEKCAFPTIMSILQGNKNTVWEDLGCLLRLCSQSDFCIAFFFFSPSLRLIWTRIRSSSTNCITIKKKKQPSLQPQSSHSLGDVSIVFV